MSEPSTEPVIGRLAAGEYLDERAALVDRHLDAVVPGPDEPPRQLHTAMRHLLFPGGKRLRPVLVLASAEALGAPPGHALALAGAVELVHTYSLIHDDLPCMDDDAERRGRPSVHVAFGEAVALLAGDALLAAAFELGSAGPADLAPRAVLETLRDLAAAAGSRKLVGGQVEDLMFGGGAADALRVESIHRRKTGALFAAATAAGARLGGADAPTVERFRSFGESLGVAFQIRDDLLDADADREAVGADRIAIGAGGVGGCSLLRAMGPEQAQARAEAHLARALEAISILDGRAEPLRELARFAVRRTR